MNVQISNGVGATVEKSRHCAAEVALKALAKKDVDNNGSAAVKNKKLGRPQQQQQKQQSSRAAAK